MGEAEGWEVGVGSPTSPLLQNRLEASDVTGSPGASNLAFQVLADHEVPVDGFTLVLEVDPGLVTIDTLSTANTASAEIGVELEIPELDPAAGTAILAVIFDFLPPYDGQSLPPAAGDLLALGTITIASGAPNGPTPLDLVNGVGSPPTDNIFVSAGLSISPLLQSGVIQIGGGAPGLFIRGDANGDGLVSIADGSTIHLFLFEGGAPPPCLDAADVNDDGIVDVSDPLYLYDFLFISTPPPPPPYPQEGSDPTPDSLDCAL